MIYETAYLIHDGVIRVMLSRNASCDSALFFKPVPGELIVWEIY